MCAGASSPLVAPPATNKRSCKLPIYNTKKSLTAFWAEWKSYYQLQQRAANLCHAGSVRPLRLHICDVSVELFELLFCGMKGHDPDGRTLGALRDWVRSHSATWTVWKTWRIQQQRNQQQNKIRNINSFFFLNSCNNHTTETLVGKICIAFTLHYSPNKCLAPENITWPTTVSKTI